MCSDAVLFCLWMSWFTEHQIRQAALQAFVESLDEVELRRALVERPRLGRELGDQVAFYSKGRVGVSDLGTLGGMGVLVV